jgi:hypothetical protein
LFDEISDYEVTAIEDGDVPMYSGNKYVNTNLADLYAPRAIVSTTIAETFDLLYDNAVSNFRLTNADGVSTTLTIHWSDRIEVLDVTDFRFTPNFGSDISPTQNFMYLTKGATINDPAVAGVNSSYPSEEYVYIGELSLFSEVTTNAETPPGAVKNQNINNHHKNDEEKGFNVIVGDYLRDLGVLYKSGLDGDGNLGTGGLQYIQNNAGVFYIKITSGVCRQFNLQQVSATDTTGTDDAHVFNDFTTPYTRITNLNQITHDSTGTIIPNGRYFNVVLNRVVNKTGEYCTMLIELPNAVYLDETDAKNDSENTVSHNVPEQFNRVYQPLVRITLKKVASGAGYEHVLTTDIRNFRNVYGGGGGGLNDTSFFANQFEIKDPVDITKKMEFDVSGVSTSTKRTLSPQDKDYTIADHADVVVLQNEVLTAETQVYPYNKAQGSLSIPKNGVPIAINEPNSVVPSDLQGQTLEQLLLNGDFTDSDISAWIDTGSASSHNVLGYLDNTGSGSTTVPRTLQNVLTIGQNYFVKSRFRVTNSLAIEISLRDGTGVFIDTQSNPVQNQWYELNGVFTATTTEFLVAHTYGSTGDANGSVMQIDYAIVIPLPSNLTLASEVEALLDGTYFEGIEYVSNPTIITYGKNKFDYLSYAGGSNWISLTENSNEIITDDGSRLIAQYGEVSLIDGQYTVKAVLGTATTYRFQIADKDTATIRFDSGNITTDYTFTLSDNYKDYYIKIFSADGTTLQDIQIELGSTATTYEAYETNTLQVQGDLQGIGGVYDDLYTQRFDRDFNDVVQSATSWTIGVVSTVTHYFYKDLQSTLLYKIVSSNGVKALVNVRIGNDIFTVDTHTNNFTNDVENVFSMDNSGNLVFRVNKTTYPNTASFEAYLQANDVEFIYELDTYLPRNETNANEITFVGECLIGDNYTYEQSSSGVIGEFDLASAINLKAQIKLNGDTDVVQGKEIVRLDSEVTTNTTNISTNASNIAINVSDITTNADDIADLQSDILVSPSLGCESVESTPTTRNLTGGKSFDTHTKHTAYFKNGNQTIAVECDLTANNNNVWANLTFNISTVGGSVVTKHAYLQRLSATTYSWYKGATVTNGTPATATDIVLVKIEGRN